MNKLTQLVAVDYDKVPDLARQISKDVNLSGISDTRFEGIISIEKLVSILKEFIGELVAYNQECFSNLMYRIDISEAKIYELEHTQLTDLVDEITYMVLKREMQKVYFKNLFSANVKSTI